MYEALRVYLYKGASLQQAADCADYTRAALASPVRDLRAGNLTVFAPPASLATRAPERMPPVPWSSNYAVTAFRSTRSAPGSPGRHPTGPHRHQRHPARGKDSPGCCAAPRRGQYQPGHLRPRHPVAGRRRPNFAALTARVHTTMAGLLLATPRVRGRKAGQLSRHRPPAHRHPPWAATPPPSSSPMTRRSRTRP